MARNRMARGIVSGLVLLVAVSATGAGATAPSIPSSIDAGIAAWLDANDLDLGDALIQQGTDLYAAPVGDMPVIQLVEPGGVGRVDCAGPCDVYQRGTFAMLTTDCVRNDSGDNVVQDCNVTQDNVDGDNILNISMQGSASTDALNVSDGITQTVRQTATCMQTNVNGANILNSTQRATLDASLTVTFPVEVIQQANTSFDCAQYNQAGSNTANILGEHIESMDVTIGSGTVRQNSVNNEPTMTFELIQRSGAGNSHADLDLNQDFDAEASAVNVGGNIRLFQGPGAESGLSSANKAGLVGRLDLDAGTGSSTADVDFARDWVANATAGLGGTRQVVQDNIFDCCLGLDQISQTVDNATLDYVSKLASNMGAAPQRATHYWRWAATQNVTANSTVIFDGDPAITFTESGPVINNNRSCVDDAGSCQSQPGHPMSFRGDVRRTSPQAEANYAAATEAPSGGKVAFRVTSQNLSTGPIADIKVVIPIPAQVTVSNLDSGCKVKGNNVHCQGGIGNVQGVRDWVNVFTLKTPLADGSSFNFTATGSVGNNPGAPPLDASAKVTVNNAIQ